LTNDRSPLAAYFIFSGTDIDPSALGVRAEPTRRSPSMEQEQQSQPLPDRAAILGWLLLISRIGAVTVEVFLHKGFGRRYIGLQALLAFVLIPLWSSFWPEHDMRAQIIFMEAYFAMLVIARMGVICNWFRGTQPHSYYSGTPHLCRLLPKLSENTVKKFVEPGVLLLVGLIVSDVSEPFGKYLMFAGICLFLSIAIGDAWIQKRAMDARDALIEQQSVADYLRRQGRW
jgi:hypothetical protein